MNIVAIISEFNPFHAGHAYLIKKAREMTQADYCIIIMSGNYVQRGEPAFLDKDLRTRAALLNGADMVFELPTPFATSSAEFFASAAISILSKLNCVTHLAFGSESGDIQSFIKLSNLLLTETSDYQKHLKESLKQGLSFPKAREKALFSKIIPAHLKEEISLLQSPNNILGLEYMKALQKASSTIEPVTVKRIGKEYHDTSLANNFEFASADGIRHAFHQTSALTSFPEEVLLAMPENIQAFIKNALQQHLYVLPDATSLPLFCTLAHASADDLIQYQGVSLDFANKILHYRDTCFLTSDLIQALKSKDLTYSRISRTLLHILLQLSKEDITHRKDSGYGSYAYMLGFRRDAALLLQYVKKASDIPIISQYREAKKYLSDFDRISFETDLRSDAFYQTLSSHSTYTLSHKSSNKKPTVKNVYSRQLIIIS